jgi:hypothetical protein
VVEFGEHNQEREAATPEWRSASCSWHEEEGVTSHKQASKWKGWWLWQRRKNVDGHGQGLVVTAAAWGIGIVGGGPSPVLASLRIQCDASFNFGNVLHFTQFKLP